MQFIKADISLLDSIMKVINDGRKSLRAMEIDQWQGTYPDDNQIINDINNDSSYVVIDDEGFVCGTVMLTCDAQDYYEKIDGNWTNETRSDNKYLTIHRLAVSSSSLKQGVASRIIDEATKIALDNSCISLRVDTHPDNIPMQTYLKKHGFIFCGNVELSDPETPVKHRLAFEKLLANK